MGAIKGRSSMEAADVRNVPQENVAHFVIQEVIYIFSKLPSLPFGHMSFNLLCLIMYLIYNQDHCLDNFSISHSLIRHDNQRIILLCTL